MKDPACNFVNSLGLRGWICDGADLIKGDVSIKTVDVKSEEYHGVNYVVMIKGEKIHVSRCKEMYTRMDTAPLHDTYFRILTHTNKTNRFSLSSIAMAGKNFIQRIF